MEDSPVAAVGAADLAVVDIVWYNICISFLY